MSDSRRAEHGHRICLCRADGGPQAGNEGEGTQESHDRSERERVARSSIVTAASVSRGLITMRLAGEHPMVSARWGAHSRSMNRNLSFLLAAAGLVAGTALLFLLTGCASEGSGRYYGDRTSVRGQAVVSFEDDYDYYPRYETYYSRNRREFVYRDGGQWVRRREPSGVSINVILATPSVRLDFRDSPERHHNDVIRSYPRDWQRTSTSVQVQGTVVFEDDYDYYPRYETYYSRSRREYVYRDGNQWVRRPQPRGVTIRALQSAPSVRMEFRDSPERHHGDVVRSYPKNWKRQDARNDRGKDAKKDNRDRRDDDRGDR